MECGEDVGGDQGLAVACGVAVRGGRGTKTDDETRVPVVVDDEQPKRGVGRAREVQATMSVPR